MFGSSFPDTSAALTQEPLPPSPNGYIIELWDEPVLEKKQEFEEEIRMLEQEILSLRRERKQIENGLYIPLIKEVRATLKEREIKNTEEEIAGEREESEQKILEYREEIKEDKNSLRGILEDFDQKERDLVEFTNSFNGFAAKISLEEAERIRTLPFVKSVYPNLEVKIELTSSPQIIKANDAWSLGYTGKNITIGIIDTGVDYTHADFAEICQSNTTTSENLPGTNPDPSNNLTWQIKTIDNSGWTTYTSTKSIRNSTFIAYTLGPTNYNYLKFAKSADGGKTFSTSVITKSNSRIPYMSLFAVNEQLIYVSFFSGYPDFDYKLAKSTNGGANWTITTSIPVDDSIGHSSLYALDAQNLFLAYDTDSSLGFAKSTDGGASWSSKIIETPPELGYVGRSPSIKAEGTNNLFVTYEYYKWAPSWEASITEQRFAKSLDSGNTWQIQKIDGNHVGGIGALESNGNSSLFIAYTGEKARGIKFAKSFNGGSTWETSTLYPDGIYAEIALDYLENGALILAGHDNSDPQKIDFAKSTDLGNNWSKEILFSDGTQGHGTSLSSSFGRTFVSYGSYDNADLRVAIQDTFGSPTTSSNSSVPPSNCDPTKKSGCLGTNCKVIGGYDFVNSDPDPKDDHGHGTHVAATAAGNGALKGIAPDAKIIAYKVLDSSGSGSFANVIAAIERSMDPNKDGDFSDHLDIISLSLGANCGGIYTSTCGPDDPQSKALDLAAANGVVVVVSAGNNGPSQSTIGSPGTSRDAITVGASDKSNVIASFSSRGPVIFEGSNLIKPDVLAPGVSICAARYATAWAGKECLDQTHVAISGTSMAAPHVAGAAAILLEKNPQWSPANIKNALKGTATNLGYSTTIQGSGLINLLKALNLTNPPPNARIEKLSYLQGSSSVLLINYTANSEIGFSYALDYAFESEPGTWKNLKSSTQQEYGAIHQFTLPVANETITIRITATDSLGISSTDSKAITTNTIRILRPENKGAVTNSEVEVIGNAIGSDFQSYTLELSSFGVIANSTAPVENSLLGTFNGAQLTQGSTYTLTLKVRTKNGIEKIKQNTFTVVEGQIFGFPITVPQNSPSDYTHVRELSAVSDIDGDGSEEIVVAYMQGALSSKIGYLAVYDHDGSAHEGFPIIKPGIWWSEGDIVLGDLDNDGKKEIVVGTVESAPQIYVFRQDGTLMTNWPKSYNGVSYDKRNIMLSDINNDGYLDVVAISYFFNYATSQWESLKLYAWDRNGNLLPGFPAADTIKTQRVHFSGIGDLNGDGNKEIVVTRSEASTANKRVDVFDNLGRHVTGKTIGSSSSWSWALALGDLEGDGKDEILVSSSETSIQALKLSNGALQTAWNSASFSTHIGFISLGNMDGDPALEVVISSDKDDYYNQEHKIAILDSTGTLLFQKSFPSSESYYGFEGGSTIADTDGNGKPNIFAVIDKSTSPKLSVHSWNERLESMPSFPKTLNEDYIDGGTPILTDLDKNGKIEAIVVDGNKKIYAYRLEGAYDREKAYWPMLLHDERHTNNFGTKTSGSQARTDFRYFTLPENDCTSTLNLTSMTGSHTLFARSSPNSCSDVWERSILAQEGESAILTQTSLSKGSYAVKINGSGNYILTQKSICLDDSTPPSVSLLSPPSLSSSSKTIKASATDTNALSRCESCFSTDGNCDSEWILAKANYSSNLREAICSSIFNSSLFPDGSYIIQFRAYDIAENLAVSPPASMVLDTAPPQFYASVPLSAEINSTLLLTAIAQDANGVQKVSYSIGGGNITMNKSSNMTFTSPLLLPLQRGTMQINFFAQDLAGNIAHLTHLLTIDEKITFSALGSFTSDEHASSNPSVAIGPDKSTHLVWEESKDGNLEIYYSKMDPTGAFTIHQKRISQNPSNSKNPSIAIDNSNNAHIVWQDDLDSNYEIFYSKIDPMGTILLDSKRITFNLFRSAYPKIFIDQENRPWIVFLDDRGGEQSLYLKRLDSLGNPLSADLLLTLPLSGPISDFSAALSLSTLLVASEHENEKIALSRHDGSGISIGSIIVEGSGRSPSITIGKEGILTSGILGYISTEPVNLTESMMIAQVRSDGTIGNTKTLPSQKNKGTIEKPVFSQTSTPSSPQLLSYVFLLPSAQLSELYFSKRTFNESFISPKQIISPSDIGSLSISSFGDSEAIAFETWADGKSEIGLISTSIDSTPPIISSIEISNIEEYSATIRLTTNEPTTIEIPYGTGAFDNTEKTTAILRSHSIILEGLTPNTPYSFIIKASDAFGNTITSNNNGNLYRFTTKQTKNQPALPTTFYGEALLRNGSAAGGIDVVALWKDTDGNYHNTTTKTLTEEGAALLGDTSLEGYFIFNKGNVLAAPLSTITVSSIGDLTDPDPSIIARPGGLSAKVNGGPLLLDIDPPKLTTLSPLEQTYSTPFLTLHFTSDEPLSFASYKLNSHDETIVSGLENTPIPFRSDLGENVLLIRAKDLLGHESIKQIRFIVIDQVPPTVTITTSSKIGASAQLIANASDSTNSLSQNCEVCVSSDGQCDLEWKPAVNGFSNGDFFGTCSSGYSSSVKEERALIIGFRLTDVAGNRGESFKEILSDSLPPDPLLLEATPVPSKAALSLHWQPASSLDTAEYRIYRKSIAFGDISSMSPYATTTNLSFIDTALNSAQTMHYAVVAVDDVSNFDPIVASKSATASDIAPPTIILSSPKKQVYSTKEIPLNFSADEPISYCVYTLNNGPTVPAPPLLNAIEGDNSMTVSCEDLSGNKGNVSISFTVDTIAPPQITSLLVIPLPSQNALRLSWTPSNETNVSYLIYKSNSSFASVSLMNSYAIVGASLTPSFIDTSLASQQSSYYAVSAVDAVGNQNKNVFSILGTSSDTLPPTLQILSPLAQIYKISTIAINFSSNEPLSSCRYSLDLGLQTSLAAGTLISLEDGSHSVFMQCNDTSGNIASKSVNFDIDAKIPSQINSLSITTQNRSSSISLSWMASNSTDINGYRIYRKNSSFTNTSSMSPLSSLSGTSYTDSNLQSEATYHYGVSAYDRYGNELKTITSVAITLPDSNPPSPPSNLSVIRSETEKKATLFWSKVSDPDFSQYRIYRAASPQVLIATINDRAVTSFEDANLTSGKTYTYTVTSADTSGNENTQVSGAVITIKDFDPPLLSITSPIQKTYSTPELSLSYASNEALSWCGYILNQQSAVGFSFNSAPILLASEGANTLSVLCNDTSGNFGESERVNFTLDTIAPPMISGIRASPLPNTSSFSLEWDPSAASDIFSYRIYLSTTPFNSTSPSLLIGTIAHPLTSWQTPSLESSTSYYLGVSAVDLAGNEDSSISPINAITNDVVAPQKVEGLRADPVSETSDLEISFIQNPENDVSFYRIYRSNASFSSIDSLLPIAQISSTSFTDRNLLSETSYWYGAIAVDSFGNFDPALTSIMGTTDSKAPKKINGLLVETINGSASLSLSWNPSPSPDLDHYNIYRSNSSLQQASGMPIAQVPSGTTSYTDSGLLSQANYHYAVTGIDTEGNENLKVTSVMGTVADITSPLITITSPLSKKYKTSSVALSYSSNEQVGECTYSLNLGPSLPFSQTINGTEGNNSITLFCKDPSGNLGSSLPLYFTIDTTAPMAITSLSAAQEMGTSKVNLQWNPSTSPDLLRYRIFRSTSPLFSVASLTPLSIVSTTSYIDSSIQSEMTYHYAIAPEDDIGNVNPTVSSAALTISDILAPTITLLSPQQKTYATTAINITYFSSEPAQSCTYQIDSSSNKSISSNLSENFAEGNHLLTLYCKDWSGNIGKKSIQFGVDISPPTPISNLQVKSVKGINALDLSFSASTSSDLSHYSIYRSALPFNITSPELKIAQITSLSYRDLGLVSEGVYYYAISPIDVFGNENSQLSSVQGIVADTIPPSKILGLSANASQGVEIELFWNRSTEEDLESYSLYKSALPFSSAHPTLLFKSGIQDTFFTDAIVEDGKTYHYGVTAKDESGNEDLSVQSVSARTKDITPPTINVLSIGDRVMGSATLKAQAADLGSGLGSCEVCVSHEQHCETYSSEGVALSYDLGDKNGTCSYVWQIEPDDDGERYYSFKASDLDGNAVSGQVKKVTIVNQSNLRSFELSLHSGWNLISVPLNLADPTIQSALSSIEGSYSRVYSYDPPTQSWLAHIPSRSLFDQPNTLLSLDVGRSYWIEMESEHSLTFYGAESLAYSTEINRGWNYIGYPYLDPKNISNALFSIEGEYAKIYAYNSQSQGWESYTPRQNPLEPNTLSSMDPGRGYLIDVLSSSTWSP